MVNFTDLNDELSEYMKEKCVPPGMPPAEMLVDGVALPKNFQKYYDRIYNMEVREDDVWIITFPKCGEKTAMT